ncbi:MAG: methylated-DNA--[protein]-cysteine S-methyltransferase [candidate division WOR-3 bacterium]
MYLLKTKYGNIGIEANSKGISKLVLNPKLSKKQANNPTDKNLKRLLSLLKDYFSGKKVDFSVELDIAQYPIFYQKVWQLVRKIPYGKTMTYSDVARKIGNPKAYRAVGQALKANPLPIVIPCHRVVKKDKSLGGFAGGLRWKQRLLEIEGNMIKN